MLELQHFFSSIGDREAMFLDHYDMSQLDPNHSIEDWKKFFKHPLVADWVLEELTMYRDKQIREILRDAKHSEKSVGVAQMINALSKLDLDQMSTNNKIFVYVYVPLDQEEMNADNVQIAPEDVFRLE